MGNDKNENKTGQAPKGQAAEIAAELAAGTVNAAPANVVPAIAAPANRFDTIFDKPVFSVAKTDKTYVGERSGEKSKKLADVIVPYIGGFAYVPGSIKAKLKKGATTPYVEFNFFQTMTTRAVEPVDPAAKAELDSWKHRTVEDFMRWYAGQDIQKAPAPPAAVEMPGVTFDV